MKWNNVYTCLVFGTTFLIGILFCLIPLLKNESKKRKAVVLSVFTITHFGIVFFATWLDSLILSLDTPINWGDFFYVRYLLIYLIDILVLFLLGKANLPTALFAVNLGYCFQHSCQYLYQIITIWLNVSMFDLDGFLIRLGFTVVFSLAFFFLTRKRILNIDQAKIKLNFFLIFFTTAATFFLIIINSYFWSMTNSEALDTNVRDQWRISILLFTAFIAILLMTLQLSVLKSDELMDDLKITKKMLHKEKEHYEHEKAVIDLMNIKSHDLKHQLMNAKTNLSEENIEELGKIVSSYDLFANTGNEAIDVILTEKEMLCQKNNIRFTAMIDGSKFSFIKESDLYSLLGNILDNAIEAVSKLPNEEDRVISISSEERGNFLILHEENLFDGNVIFNNGQLETTKGDKRYHGYGTKSVKFITEKYGGLASFKMKDRRFIIDLLFIRPNE